MVKVGWGGLAINKITWHFTKHEQKITFYDSLTFYDSRPLIPDLRN